MTPPRTISARLYRRLLALYPRAFRAEYGELMESAFSRLCAEARDRPGVWGAAGLWGLVLRDLIVSLIQQHMNHWNVMKTISTASVGALGGGLLLGASTFVLHSPEALFCSLVYVSAGLLFLHAVLACFRHEVPWWKDLLAALVVFVALAVFMPWWAKVGQQAQIRLQSGLLMTPLLAHLVLLVVKAVIRFRPRLAR